MILEHDGKTPRIHEGARIAPNAVICGDVVIGANASIGFGAVVTAESGPVRIGDNCVIMENAVLRGVRNCPLRLGSNVLVGPHAYLSGCDVGDNVFIATGASIFNGARIGEGAEVRINGIVHIKTVLEADATVPIGWVAVGDPAQIFPSSEHERIWDIQKTLDFPRFVFGADRPPPGTSMMPDVMRRYTRALSRHAQDRIVAP